MIILVEDDRPAHYRKLIENEQWHLKDLSVPQLYAMNPDIVTGEETFSSFSDLQKSLQETLNKQREEQGLPPVRARKKAR